MLVAVDSSSQDRRIVQAQQMLTSWSETIAKANTDATYTVVSRSQLLRDWVVRADPGAAPRLHSIGCGTDRLLAGRAAGSFQPCAADEGVRRLHLRITVNAALYPTFNVDRYVLVRRPCSSC